MNVKKLYFKKRYIYKTIICSVLQKPINLDMNENDVEILLSENNHIYLFLM